jgi:hypothetical protein
VEIIQDYEKYQPDDSVYDDHREMF